MAAGKRSDCKTSVGGTQLSEFSDQVESQVALVETPQTVAQPPVRETVMLPLRSPQDYSTRFFVDDFSIYFTVVIRPSTFSFELLLRSIVQLQARGLLFGIEARHTVPESSGLQVLAEVD
ncbi:unnamed protein product [Amoebophrya sp. A25]|nr:unnamed protein product [Amoebophrya sp. A25]|eukprot:GSA25T00021952001.1